MRKLTSHYCLKPDQTWAKRPIIELDNFGKIIAFREMGDDFVEEPNLEYFPGVIIPSLLMELDSDHTDKSLINRSIVEGARRFIVDREIKLPTFVRAVKRNDIQIKNDKTPWERIKEDSIEGHGLASAVAKQTKAIAEHYQLDNKWGVIKIDAEPGLILLQGVDLKNFELTANVTMKVLIE